MPDGGGHACEGALLLSVALLGLAAAPGAAESVRARDTAAVQNCLKSEHGRELDGERCIGVVAEPCLDKANSTVGAERVLRA